MMNVSDLQCEDVYSVNESQRCEFVKSVNDCYVEEGLFEYTIFLYCSFPFQLFPLGVTIYVLWLGFLFVALAVAASNFFCPSLIVIAKVLRMSDNIAGITLLAFGNGAPDVFSAIAAVRNMKHGDTGLIFGALIGAGVFLTTIVVGSIAVAMPFKSMERPFLRDIIFYMVTTYFTFYICYNGSVNIYEASGFIIGYAVYVAVVLIGRVINQKLKKSRLSVQADPNILSEERQQFLDSDNFRPADPNRNDSRNSLMEEEEYINSDNFKMPRVEVCEPDDLPLLPAARISTHEELTEMQRFLYAISPVDIVEWKNSSNLERILSVIKAPALFAFKLTAPVVDKSCPLQNWSKPLNVLHCPIALTFSIFAMNYEYALYKICGVFPIYALVLVVGIVLGALVCLTSHHSRPPSYHAVFAFVGFFVAVLWIKAIAGEIINILQMFGIVFSISSAILGLTLLAWGNSIGDYISDISMARKGYPRAGFSACFGGPLFNTLLGIGIPFTMATLKEPSKMMPVSYEPIQAVLLGTLAISLLSSLLIIPLQRFNVGRVYGAYLILLYIAFLVMAILVENHVIQF